MSGKMYKGSGWQGDQVREGPKALGCRNFFSKMTELEGTELEGTDGIGKEWGPSFMYGVRVKNVTKSQISVFSGRNSMFKNKRLKKQQHKQNWSKYENNQQKHLKLMAFVSEYWGQEQGTDIVLFYFMKILENWLFNLYLCITLDNN